MPYNDINDILKVFEAYPEVSDIHLSADEYISYRSVGEIVFMRDYPKLTQDELEMISKKMLTEYRNGWDKLQKDRELDFSFYSEAGIPYRVNAYYSLKDLGMALRKISNKPLPLNKLIYDDIAQAVVDHVLNQKTGLFLVTWPTGSWKTTSLIAMIEWLNNHRKEHIITIEDPIEFIFEWKGCLISQRELGSDTNSFAGAMKSAMRQDPDIIFVWEIRDPETADAALKLAETGHLVFSTLHTRNAADTVYRFVSLFPAEMQAYVKDRLASGLLWIQSQFLLKTSDGKGRVWLYELLLNNTAVRNDIRKNEGKLINSIIETSRQSGMISHTEYAKRLIAEGIITKAEVERLFD